MKPLERAWVPPLPWARLCATLGPYSVPSKRTPHWWEGTMTGSGLGHGHNCRLLYNQALFSQHDEVAVLILVPLFW